MGVGTEVVVMLVLLEVMGATSAKKIGFGLFYNGGFVVVSEVVVKLGLGEVFALMLMKDATYNKGMVIHVRYGCYKESCGEFPHGGSTSVTSFPDVR